MRDSFCQAIPLGMVFHRVWINMGLSFFPISQVRGIGGKDEYYFSNPYH